MKNLIVVLILFVVSVSVSIAGLVSAFAEDNSLADLENGSQFEYEDFICEMHDGVIHIIGYTASEDEVIIPANIEDFPVTEISERAFKENADIVSVVISDGVEVIGAGAFQDCAKLEMIQVPDSINTISSFAFKNCVNLKSFDFPENLRILQNGSFRGCDNLKEMTIPSTATRCYLGLHLQGSGVYSDEKNWIDGALYIDGVLISVKDEVSGEFRVEDGTKAVSYLAFGQSGVTDVILPDGVTHISKDVLGLAKNAKSITIPESVTFIDEDAFRSNKTPITIYGYKNSYVEEYATTKNIKFIVIDVNGISGDANSDGKLNIKDATTIQKHLAKIIALDDNSIKLSDFNNDSKVDVKDATAIQKHLAGITSR